MKAKEKRFAAKNKCNVFRDKDFAVMVLPNNTFSNALPPIKWIGAYVSAHMLNKHIWFYNQCILGPLSLKVGDFILVANADAAEPDTVNGCDIAKIIHLFEERDDTDRDPYRAIVQWYSRPKSLPARCFGSENISINFDIEVVEEHRPYDPDISLEAIFQKCFVLHTSTDTNASDVLEAFNKKGNYFAVFVCRYRFTKVKNSYRLLPLEIEEDQITSQPESDTNHQLQKDHGVKENLRKRRASVCSSNTNVVNNVEKVTPIKIIDGQKVVRVSKTASTTGKKRRSERKLSTQNTPLCEQNPVSQIRESLVCRDLSSCLEQDIDSPAKNSPAKNSPQCLNYSLVQTSPTSNDLAADLKIKLKLSSRQSRKSETMMQDSTNSNHLTVKESKNAYKLESSSESTRTPKSSKLKLLKSGAITPNLGMRTHHSTHSTDHKTDIQSVRELLHVSVVPKNMPCREKEFQQIYNFLEAKLLDQCSGCIYISGLPGTGKTATVTGVINALQQDVVENLLPAFDFIAINGMRLTEPRQAYVHIYRELTGKTVAWEQAHSLLQKRFTSSTARRSVTILLIDELDMLCNRRQDVVYNLLDWPTKVDARLVVVTIANTMDLPERLLIGKVASRLGLTRLSFQPYSYKQLQEIVTKRLCGTNAFKVDAVQLVARKVAAVSGDARRALDICRRAAEIADSSADASQPLPSVNIIHVQQALTELVASAKVQAIKNCSRMEQIFLQAIVAEMERTGIEETIFLDVYTQVKAIATFIGRNVPTIGQALHISSKLGAERLIICEDSRQDLYGKIFLNVSSDDIHYALKIDASGNLLNS